MSQSNKTTLITFRALINNKIGIIDVKKNQEEEEDVDSEEPTDTSGEGGEELILEEIGSELSEEAYDYSDDET